MKRNDIQNEDLVMADEKPEVLVLFLGLSILLYAAAFLVYLFRWLM